MQITIFDDIKIIIREKEIADFDKFKNKKSINDVTLKKVDEFDMNFTLNWTTFCRSYFEEIVNPPCGIFGLYML